jgi:hypothetical protein
MDNLLHVERAIHPEQTDRSELQRTAAVITGGPKRPCRRRLAAERRRPRPAFVATGHDVLRYTPDLLFKLTNEARH